VPDNAIPTPCPGPRDPYDPRAFGGGAIVPYVGAWTGEETLPAQVVQRTRGIGYADETLADRDEAGVLWLRMASRIGVGRPLFTQLHPLRQRRTMRRLLCQVCTRPADRTEQGVLWLLPGEPGQQPPWPEGMVTVQPPLCLPCARTSIRMCPALRQHHVAVRAHAPLCGVTGLRYRRGRREPQPIDEPTLVFDYNDPRIAWIQAIQLARSLDHCTPVDLASDQRPHRLPDTVPMEL
jgi:hypothetical protein